MATPKHYENSVRLRDGQILLYQRSDHIRKRWYARLSVGGRYIVIACKTYALDEAIELANEKYDSLRRLAKAGLPVFGNTSWTKVWKEYDEGFLSRRVTATRRVKLNRIWRKWVDAYWCDKEVKTPTETALEEFWNWRTESQEAKNATLLDTSKTMGRMFRYALQKGYIAGVLPAMTPPLSNEEDARRGSFSLQQVRQMPDVLRQWMGKDITERDQDRLFARTMFYYFTLTSVFSGLRIGEVLTLQWNDVVWPKDGQRFEIVVRTGKTGRRIVIPDRIVRAYLVQWKLATNYKKDDDYVFPLWNGQKRSSHSIGRLFHRCFHRHGWTTDRFNLPLTPYSFRSTYITNMLIYKGHKVSVWDISLNCGVDVNYIRKNYSKMIPSDVADRLGGK